MPAEIEVVVRSITPTMGALRVEQESQLKSLAVSSGGMRSVWQRHNLLTKHKCLLRLEKATAERVFGLSEEQARMLERLSPEFRGIIERFYRTLLDEHFWVEGSKNRFETIDEM